MILTNSFLYPIQNYHSMSKKSMNIYLLSIKDIQFNPNLEENEESPEAKEKADPA